ncbi:MAG: hypothetical protein WC734_06025 [Patescibacteria group bacterium]|jgi:hypothetical protein
MVTIKEYAAANGVSEVRVRQLIKAGRIPYVFGTVTMIDPNTPYPDRKRPGPARGTRYKGSRIEDNAKTIPSEGVANG